LSKSGGDDFRFERSGEATGKDFSEKIFADSTIIFTFVALVPAEPLHNA
jgi:hypothetical protein